MIFSWFGDKMCNSLFVEDQAVVCPWLVSLCAGFCLGTNWFRLLILFFLFRLKKGYIKISYKWINKLIFNLLSMFSICLSWDSFEVKSEFEAGRLNEGFSEGVISRSSSLIRFVVFSANDSMSWRVSEHAASLAT